MSPIDPPVTRLVLVRHGESVAQVEGYISGHESCKGLSELGRRQAEALRDRLARTGEVDADVLLTSILPRAVETAEILAPALGGLEAVQDCDLCEIHPGEAEGLTWDEFQSRYLADGRQWSPDEPTAPGGESWHEFTARAAAGLRRWAEEHAGKSIVAAVHGGIIESAMATFMDLPPTAVPISHVVNTSITEWALAPHPYRGGDRRWQLVRYNDHAHLAEL